LWINHLQNESRSCGRFPHLFSMPQGARSVIPRDEIMERQRFLRAGAPQANAIFDKGNVLKKHVVWPGGF
jgi:hypothetical protein